MTRFSPTYNLADMRKLALDNFDYVKKLHPANVTENRNEYIKKLDDINNDPVFRSAVRAINILAELAKPIDNAITEIEKTTKLNIRDNFFTPNKQKDKENINRKLFFIPGSKPEALRVFPEIWLTNNDTSWFSTQDVRNINAYFSFYLNHWYNTTKANPKAWSPLSRGLTRMFKRVEISVAAALQRYTNLPNVYSEADINKIAEHITNYMRPVEIIEARTPDEFKNMYWTEGGPASCMTPKGEGGRYWAYMVDKQGIHPAAWYTYTGNTFGLYMKKGSAVTARAIIYNISQKNDTPVWEMGRLYATTEFARTKFIEEAKKRGIIVGATKDLYLVHRDWEFNVPVVHDKDADRDVVPMPFIDNLSNGFTVAVNKENTQVTFKSCLNTTNSMLRGTGGFISTRDLIKARCDYCGGSIRATIRTQDNAHTVCSAGCANSLGYVGAIDSEGIRRYVRESQAYRLTTCNDPTNTPRQYTTTEDAAVRRAAAGPGLMHIHDSNVFLDREDDTLYTPYLHNTVIRFNSGARVRTLPIHTERTQNWTCAIPTKVILPFSVKRVSAVEISENDHYLSEDIKSELATLVAEVNSKPDPTEVAPGVPADIAPKSPTRQKRTPVRFVSTPI